MLRLSFDPAKNERNIAERGIPFTMLEQFDWETAFVWEDRSKDHGEQRFSALRLIAGRVHGVTFTVRGGTVHVISLRKANRR